MGGGDLMFLQSFIAPIVLFYERQDGAHIDEAIGTSFFINLRGTFLTCRHVAIAAQAKAKTKKCEFGLVVKADDGTSKKSEIARIRELEDAPAPYDVCIGRTDYNLSSRFLALSNKSIDVWQEIATGGYPLSAISGNPVAKQINMRVHKGIVQRILQPDSGPVGQHPKGYELSFLVGTGISGSPLFLADSTDILPVIGICVGSSRSEEIDEVSEVKEGNTVFRETKLRITEHGIAHDLVSLHDWKPKMLQGKTLIQAAQD